jgi:hypothetical protein
MDRKKLIILGVVLLLLSPINLRETLAQPAPAGPSSTVNRERYDLMMRKGKEAFARLRYNEAKDFFRKAIQADPFQQGAWSYYDLAQMYAVAEQYKNHGRIIHSTAPEPGPETAQPPQPAPPLPKSIPAGTPAKAKGKVSPAKKEKAVTPPESKSGETGESKPAAPAGQAPVPIKPAQPPGGMKILKDEGC